MQDVYLKCKCTADVHVFVPNFSVPYDQLVFALVSMYDHLATANLFIVICIVTALIYYIWPKSIYT